jgi:2-aminoethylphosphonate-pyruvate transaminase
MDLSRGLGDVYKRQILYPGKLTEIETFRVGCIGAIGPIEMQQAVHAVALALKELSIASGAPA